MKLSLHTIIACLVLCSAIQITQAASTVVVPATPPQHVPSIVPAGQETYEHIKAKYPWYRGFPVTRVPSKERYQHRLKIAEDRGDDRLAISIIERGYTNSAKALATQRDALLLSSFLCSFCGFCGGAMFVDYMERDLRRRRAGQ